MKPKLPIGLQNLREMRTEGYVYVDKTAHVARLAEEGKYYFLARPRRFGKSLLVDTLAEAFAGSRELFEGLYLENHWDWSRKYPVLRFDFSRGVLPDRALLEATLAGSIAAQPRTLRSGVGRRQPVHLALDRLVRNLRRGRRPAGGVTDRRIRQADPGQSARPGTGPGDARGLAQFLFSAQGPRPAPQIRVADRREQVLQGLAVLRA